MGVTINQTAGFLLSLGKEQQKFPEPSLKASRRNQPARYNSQTVTPFSDAQTKPSQRKEPGSKSTSPNCLPPGLSLCVGGWLPSESDRWLAWVTYACNFSAISVAGRVHSLDPGIGAGLGQSGAVRFVFCILTSAFFILPASACLPSLNTHLSL